MRFPQSISLVGITLMPAIFASYIPSLHQRNPVPISPPKSPPKPKDTSVSTINRQNLLYKSGIHANHRDLLQDCHPESPITITTYAAANCK